MTSPFERLPAEVFDIIAACLDLPRYHSLRLTSQRLHLLTLSTFTKKYFATLITTLGSPSLDRLVGVASHNHLSQSVTTLEIRLLNHRDYKDLSKIARIGIFPPPKRFPKVSCIRSEHIVRESTLHDDVLANRHAKCITERLARGLVGFDKLKTIRFRAHQTEPLEWKTVTIPDEDDVFRSRCLRAVFDAIVKSGIELDTFSMGKEKGLATLSKYANVPFPALQLPIEYLQRLRPCLQELDTLTLSIVSQHNGHHRLPGWENGLSRFIAITPGLRQLTLSLDRKCQVSQYGARIIRALSDSTQFQNLETFHLCNSTFHESDLAKLIKTHAGTLQRLILTNVCLLTGNWVSLLSSFKAARHLRYLRLASIDGAGSPMRCRQRDKERRKIILNASEQEPCMSDLLDELGRAVMDAPVSMYV
ncbi:Protein-lysine N-methyltransferase efm4 [Ascochyta clinopodiicola]|nr:Protein-lysine N-methyltransferase efm4 [Ascochyta clinopodiicola]